MKLTLQLAAIYNILWGAWVVLFPNMFWGIGGYGAFKSTYGVARNGDGNRGLWIGVLVGEL